MVGDWKKLTIAGVVVAILLLLPLVVELGTDTMNLLIMLFIYIILSQSWNLIGGYAGQINLGLAAFFGTGVMVTHFLWSNSILPVYLAVFIGGVATVLLASVIGLPTLRLKGSLFGIGTLALAEAMRITIGNLFPRTTYMPASYAATYSLVPRYYFALAIMLFALAVIYAIANSKLGLAIMALRDDEDAAEVTGVNIFKYKVVAFLISAFLAGLGGGIYAYFRMSLYPTYVFVALWTFEPLMAACIGGAGTFLGPVIGSAFLVILQEFFALNLGEAHLIIFGILFILVVLFLPTGLIGAAGKIHRLATRVARGKPQVAGETTHYSGLQ